MAMTWAAQVSAVCSIRKRMRKLTGHVLLSAAIGLLLASCGSDPAAPVEDGASTDVTEADVVDATDSDADSTLDSSLDVSTEPDEIPLPTGTIDDGEECLDDSECISGHCFTYEEGFPEGMCSPTPCGPETVCNGANTVCFAPAEGEPFCSRRCTAHSDCRNQYECDFIQDFGFGACVPGPPPVDLPDGEPCSDDAQCLGGTCLRPPQYPGGYCTTLQCETFEDCARGDHDNRCLIAQGGGTNFCVSLCEANADCRARYVCTPIAENQGYCAPDPNQPGEVDTDSSALGFECNPILLNETQQRISFEVEEGSSAYMVVPIALDGRRLLPNRIRVPGDGSDINLASGENVGQSATSLLLGYVSPIIVPWLPTLTDQLHTGAHDFDVETQSGALCHYVLQEESAGEVIDFNVYLVGVPDLRAEIAPGDLNLSAVFEQVDSILDGADLGVGEVRYFDVDEEIVERYSIIRSDGDVFELVAFSEEPGESLDDLLSVNIFITQAFQMNGPIGISPGIPGPAGLHSAPGSGVVLTGEALGQGDAGNILTAQTLVHEIGHYLGLWHTSELGGGRFDPLDDTAECLVDSVEECPDFNNLMFPLAGTSHVQLSDGQGFMLQQNPLSKD